MHAFIFAAIGAGIGVFIGACTGYIYYRRLTKSVRQYGPNGTIHKTTRLDIETHKGKVVSVWFRCQKLPFRQGEVGPVRVNEMELSDNVPPELLGVIIKD